MDVQALWLSIQLATCTTAILLVVGLPLAYWLATTRWPGRFLVDAVVALPIVLPPTVLGFYLLWATGPASFAGQAFESAFHRTLPFTFPGILLASVIYNLPFAVRPFRAALETVDRSYVEASWCLGVSRVMTFFRVTLPLAWPGVLAGSILTFAHCLGEFGVVLMIGGNIPGVTRTLSIAIYDDVQSLDYQSAGRASILLVLFSLAILCIVHVLQQPRRRR